MHPIAISYCNRLKSKIDSYEIANILSFYPGNNVDTKQRLEISVNLLLSCFFISFVFIA